MEPSFSFQITPPDPDRLLCQVARALETRTELVSREKCPRLWALADGSTARTEARRPCGKKGAGGERSFPSSIGCWD